MIGIIVWYRSILRIKFLPVGNDLFIQWKIYFFITKKRDVGETQQNTIKAERRYAREGFFPLVNLIK